MTEYIQLTDDTRVAVTYDDDADNPREFSDGWVTSAYDAGTWTGRRAIGDEFPGGNDRLYLAWLRIPDAHNKWGHRETANLERWARIFYGLEIVIFQTSWIWWVDPDKGAEAFHAELTPETQIALIHSEHAQLVAWQNGEAQRVTIQHRIRYARVVMDAAGQLALVNPLTENDIEDEWIEWDSVGNNYFTDEWTAFDCAETLDLTNEERAALLDAKAATTTTDRRIV